MIKIPKLTKGRRSVFPGGRAMPHPKGRGSSVPETNAHTLWETETKFCVVMKLDVRKIL